MRSDYVKPGEFVSRLQERAKFTPDFSDLRWYHSITVMVYDELQCGFTLNKEHLEGAEYLGSGLTIAKRFQMKKVTKIRPIVFERDERSPLAHHIRGDVYMVNVEHLHMLDRYYFNGVVYNRILTKVWLPKMPVETDQVKFWQSYPWIHCYMYVGKDTRWQNSVLQTHGSKVDMTIDAGLFKNRPYYMWDWMDSSYPDDDAEDLQRYNYLNQGMHIG